MNAGVLVIHRHTWQCVLKTLAKNAIFPIWATGQVNHPPSLDLTCLRIILMLKSIWIYCTSCLFCSNMSCPNVSCPRTLNEVQRDAHSLCLGGNLQWTLATFPADFWRHGRNRLALPQRPAGICCGGASRLSSHKMAHQFISLLIWFTSYALVKYASICIIQQGFNH